MSDAWEAAEDLLSDLVGLRRSGTEHRVAHDHFIQFARQIIKCIADLSEALGEEAGVGGMETAGGIISYLSANPVHIEPLLRGGIFELPSEWMRHGRLTWQGQDGKIWHPEQARRAAVIKKLERGA